MEINYSISVDVKPTIITLEWPQDMVPSRLTKFETEARRLRYQALGRACQEQGIEQLFLAHHNDDQAETVLTRLAAGHGHLGLQGINTSGEIPECWGMHGIHRSGGERLSKVSFPTQSQIHDWQCFQYPVVPLENGGITVHRPLLDFPKERLIETCRSADVHWVEDQTNYDPTLTTRNAARKLLSTRDLPQALQKHSLLQAARVSSARTVTQKALARHLYGQCKLCLDTRSGTLLLAIPRQLIGNQPVSDAFAIGFFLRELAQHVSPQEKVTHSSLQPAVAKLFFDQGTSSPAPFTAGRVLWKPFEIPPFSKAWRTIPRSDDYRTWALSRQPYYRCETFPVLIEPSKHSLTLTEAAEEKTAQFQLWDGRYWIRIRNKSRFSLCLRPMCVKDRKLFYARLKPNVRDKIKKMIKEIAPASAQWTLPAIALKEEDRVDEHDDKIVALPSLGIVLPSWKNEVAWDIRYKKVDFSFIVHGAHVPYPTHKDR